MSTIHVGIVGLGSNTRLRHVPGLRACDNVEIVGVCNRRIDSTQQVAQEFGIPKTYGDWQSLVADESIDAVVIGTWPYLHCPITLAAFEAGKHVLTEARMALNSHEARQMFSASQQHPELIAQIVPSPFGLKVDRVVRELLADGFIGDLREAVVLGTNNVLSNPEAPLHWRQSFALSGVNMLALGILHETLIRWTPDPLRVTARTQVFTTQRRDAESGALLNVDTPDSVQVLTELPGGARGLYHLSGVLHFGPGMQIHLYGSEGTLKLIAGDQERLLGARAEDGNLREIPIPPEKSGDWRVEEEFVNAIRGEEQIRFTNFATGVRYMEFTEAVANSAEQNTFIDLPLDSDNPPP